MKTDSVALDSLRVGVQMPHAGTSTWMWWIIALLVLAVLVLIGMCVYYRSEHYKSKRKLRGQGGDIDFDGVMRSAFQAKALYDQLKAVCHPDKFATEPDKFEKATEIFALLVKNKCNYDKLYDLKKRAEKELNIKI